MTTLFKNISIDEAKILLEQKATVIDIRDHSSYIAGHLATAQHIHDENVQQFIQESDWDKPLLVYCYHGHSSQNAAQFLAEQGFEEVYSLMGGYTAWHYESTTS